MGSLFRKGFVVELENSLTCPTTEVICETLARTQDDVEFISAGKPVLVKVKEGVFEVEVRMVHGGYELFCREVEQEKA